MAKAVSSAPEKNDDSVLILQRDPTDEDEEMTYDASCSNQRRQGSDEAKKKEKTPCGVAVKKPPGIERTNPTLPRPIIIWRRITEIRHRHRAVRRSNSAARTRNHGKPRAPKRKRCASKATSTNKPVPTPKCRSRPASPQPSSVIWLHKPRKQHSSSKKNSVSTHKKCKPKCPLKAKPITKKQKVKKCKCKCEGTKKTQG